MSRPSNPEANLYHSGPIWSRSEKSIARTAFDAALGRELHEVIQMAKQMANEDPAVVGSVGFGTLPDRTP